MVEWQGWLSRASAGRIEVGLDVGVAVEVGAGKDVGAVAQVRRQLPKQIPPRPPQNVVNIKNIRDKISNGQITTNLKTESHLNGFEEFSWYTVADVVLKTQIQRSIVLTVEPL